MFAFAGPSLVGFAKQKSRQILLWEDWIIPGEISCRYLMNNEAVAFLFYAFEFPKNRVGVALMD